MRPGVATTMSTPSLERLDLLVHVGAAVDGEHACGRRASASGASSSCTCTASSRVGTSTSARGRFGSARLEPLEDRAARRRASCPSRSWPCRTRRGPASASGMVMAWIGKAVSMPRSRRTATRSGDTPSASNVVAHLVRYRSIARANHRAEPCRRSGIGRRLRGTDRPTDRMRQVRPSGDPELRDQVAGCGPAARAALDAAGAVSAIRREVRLDRRDDSSGRRARRRGREAGDDVAVGAHEELLEVPLDVAGGARRRRRSRSSSA